MESTKRITKVVSRESRAAQKAQGPPVNEKDSDKLIAARRGDITEAFDYGSSGAPYRPRINKVGRQGTL